MKGNKERMRKEKKSRDCKGTINHIVPHINDISARQHFLNHQKAEKGEKITSPISKTGYGNLTKDGID